MYTFLLCLVLRLRSNSLLVAAAATFEAIFFNFNKFFSSSESRFLFKLFWLCFCPRTSSLLFFADSCLSVNDTDLD